MMMNTMKSIQLRRKSKIKGKVLDHQQQRYMYHIHQILNNGYHHLRGVVILDTAEFKVSCWGVKRN